MTKQDRRRLPEPARLPRADSGHIPLALDASVKF
jgi:hypothetical protein